MNEREDNPVLKKNFEMFAEKLWAEYGIVIQLQREFGRRLSYVAGRQITEHFLFPPMRFDLTDGYALSLWGLEKLSSENKDKVIQDVEKFKMKSAKCKIEESTSE
jgi:hypothetical protein